MTNRTGIVAENAPPVALLAAAAMLLGAAVPAVAQTSAVGEFDEWHARLLGAAEAAAAEVHAGQRVQTPALAVPRPTTDFSPPWLKRLAPETWRLLHESFAAEGIPAELVSLGWVESRFQADAFSPKGARGVWQLMPTTARRYGLTVSRERDDRTDLVASTRAAARHLADLHEQFGDWLLALAAYNAGAGRVEAAISRAESRDFWRLRPWLPAETQAYVPRALAAMGSEAGAVTGGGAPMKTPPFARRIVFATLVVDGPATALPSPTTLAPAGGI